MRYRFGVAMPMRASAAMVPASSSSIKVIRTLGHFQRREICGSRNIVVLVASVNRGVAVEEGRLARRARRNSDVDVDVDGAGIAG